MTSLVDPTQIVTSPDGQWAVVRDGRKLAALASGAGPAVGTAELDADDAELALVGPPTMLVVVSRAPGANKLVLYQPPYLDAVARLDLDRPMRLASTTGARVALLAVDNSKVVVVRVAGRAMQAMPLEAPGPIEFAVGMERNQVLLGLLKKFEVWDGVSGRPLVRMALQLPPAPRVLGAAQGHLWAMRAGGEEIFVYRLSDGRPFRHYAGASIQEVVAHPASPLVVIATSRGLVRLHCFAHSLTVIDAPWTAETALALLPVGDEVTLLGLPPGAEEPWRVAVSGSGPAPATEAPASAAAVAAPSASSSSAARDESTAPAARGKAWREPVVVAAAELLRGAEVELPIVAVDTELGELAHALGLGSPARRALIALYGLYLLGEPAISLARLAHALGDWTEALGKGELVANGLAAKVGGKIALVRGATEFLDGTGPIPAKK